MTPTEAGFDGERGVNLNIPPMMYGGIYKLRRGSKKPDLDKYNYKNQLLWYTPENEEPKLLYCSKNNQLFELNFTPIVL